MNTGRFEKLAPLSGIGMIVLLVTGHILSGGFGGYGATAEMVIESVSQDPSRVYAGTLLAGFYAMIFMLLFAGSLYGALREHEGGSGYLSTIAFGGGVISTFALALGYGVVRQAVATNDLVPAQAAVLHDLYSVLLAGVLSLGLSAFIGATGVVSLRIKLFPQWFGVTSVVIALGLLTPIHYIFEGFALIWVVIVSIVLYQRGGSAGTS